MVVAKILRGFACVWISLMVLVMAVGYGMRWYQHGFWVMFTGMQDDVSPFNVVGFLVNVVLASPAIGAWFLADYVARRQRDRPLQGEGR